MANVKPIPDGASVVIPRLVCRDVVVELDFCVTTFRASVLNRRPGPDGTIVHGLMTIGPAMVMIESEWPAISNRAPQLDGSSPVMLYVYVEDVDSTVERAVSVGATVLSPPANQLWGDRTSWVMDPSGHVWTIASRIEETTEDERRARLSAVKAATQ